jgi:uncharacterized membrane protein YhaH (DUF805 family)
LPVDSAPEAALKPARIDLIELLFSSTGRLSRTAFLGCAAFLLALATVWDRVGAGMLHWRWGWLFYTALLFPTACVLSKRLHDRGRAGWWAFLVVWALIEVWPRPQTPMGWVFVPILAFAFIELGLMPGLPGANRFGPNPAESRA